jgi:hypothetical protein
MEREPLRAVVYEQHDKDADDAWAVEAIAENGQGDIFTTVFYGPHARERAVEYAHAKYETIEVWKNGGEAQSGKPAAHRPT